MKPDEIFKRYDIRGRYPDELDEEFAERLGKTLGSLGYEKVAASRDNKDTSPDLKEALISGLEASGVQVFDVGSGPSDYAAWSGRELDAISVQITSSHLPLEFNGFKLTYPEGNDFVNEDLNRVEEKFRSGDFSQGDGEVVERGLFPDYREALKDFASEFQEEEKRIVHDSMGGITRFLPGLLEEMGHEVITVDREEMVDPPNPKPGKLEALKRKVEETDADLGIANDLDGDRITVYRDGFVSGDELFCILAQLKDEIVASIDTTSAIEELGDVSYTRVGSPFVMEEAVEREASLAGEPNGHYAFPELIPYHSGALTALVIAGLNLEERMKEVPKFETRRESFRTEDKYRVIEELKEAFSDRVVSEMDGVKLEFPGCSVLLRPSGSSPKVRFIGDIKESDEGFYRAIEEAGFERS